MLFSANDKLILTGILLGCSLAFGCHKQATGSEEICNNQDDDWDGLTDEPFTDDQGRYNHKAHCGGCGIDCEALLPSAEEVACEETGDNYKCKIASCPEGTHLTNENFCAPNGDIACLPCLMDIDCSFRDPSMLCKSLPTGSKRCLMRCAETDPECPSGYTCQMDGGESFCYPTSGFCDCGEFETVSEDADGGADGGGGDTDGGTRYGCLVDNPDGTYSCEGYRQCVDGGLTPCEPLYEEVCDGKDNNCDGQADEPFMKDGIYIDSLHCGACNHPCVPLAPHTTATCTLEPEAETASCVRDCEEGYVDLDGAGINGCECAKTEAVWPPQALGQDLDCDGSIDDTSQFVFVSKLGDDNNRGEMDSPVLTINEGIKIAAPEGKTVLVAQGNYAEQVVLSAGVSLFGGYRTDFLKRDTALFAVVISGRNDLPGRPVLVAKDITTPTEAEGFILQGQNASSPGAGSTAVLLSRCTAALSLKNLKVIAGKGMSGKDGKTSVEILSSDYGGAKPSDLDGIAGGNGKGGFSANTRQCKGLVGNGGTGGNKVCPLSKGNVSGGKGGNASCPDTGCKIGSPCANAGCTDFMIGNTCDFKTMLSLARPNPPAADGKGPAGGKAGDLTYDAPTTRINSNFCDDNPTLLREGANGESGGAGVDGQGGLGCTNIAGVFDSNTGVWKATDGTHGADGTDGSGGGGGTQGNGYDVLIGAALNYDDQLGGAGGGGGSGACGSPGAEAGGGGGGSIGIAIVLGDSDGPTIEDVRVIPNRAGEGGAGGIGASGGAPGSGGQGGAGNFWCAREGGAGGDGGKGGHGGGGGGGCGGSVSGFHVVPSEDNSGIEYIGALLELNSVDAVPAPGSGGRGGFSPGSSGANGAAGTSAAFRLYGAAELRN